MSHEIAPPVGLIMAAVVSALLLGIATFGVRGSVGRAIASFLVNVFLLGLLVCPSLLWANLLVVYLVLLIARPIGASRRAFAISGAIATVLCYVTAAIGFLPEYHERQALRAQFPLESMQGRLAAVHGAPAPTVPNILNDGQKERLNGFEQQLNSLPDSRAQWRRERSLWSLHRTHAGIVHEFIDAQDFGVRRMPVRAPKREDIEIPELPSIPQPDPRAIPSTFDLATRPQAPPTRMPADFPAPAQIETAHTASVIDFVNVAGFGLKMHDRGTVGFQAHGFRAEPTFPSSKWKVATVELVSLLMHETPVVYVSATLPRMDELRAAPTREFDAFETEALAQLLAGEDIVTRRFENQIRMLGSIRSIDQCIDCHQAKRGALLGAFSYRLSQAE